MSSAPSIEVATRTAATPVFVQRLEDAIAEFVAPGMTVQIDSSAQAAVPALLRVFAGTQPGLEAIVVRGGMAVPDLLAAGVIRKAICGGLVNPFLRPGAAEVMQRDYWSGAVELELWSLYSLVQRLMAGALQWPFVPVRSIVGSDMQRRNRDAIRTISDPFRPGQSAQVVLPLNPDVAIVHSAACDARGVPLFTPPLEDSLWGAKAAKRAVIVVTEAIVDEEVIRAHPEFVRLSPGNVDAVVQVTNASHPYRMNSRFPDLNRPYLQDVDWLRGYATAVRSVESHHQWLEDWVYGLANHEEYLARVEMFHNERQSSPTKISTPVVSPEASAPSMEEWLVIAAARRIVSKVRDEHFNTVLVGTGLGALPCALAAEILDPVDGFCEFVMGGGVAGYAPQAGDSARELRAATQVTDTSEVYGVLVGGARRRSLAILGAAQMDRCGNINTSELPGEKLFLTGSGGANDAATLSNEVFVVGRERPGRFVAKVDFVTCPGARVSTLFTDTGVLTKPPGDENLTLVSRFPLPVPVGSTVATWTGQDIASLPTETPPTALELQILRRLRSGPSGGED